jgi:hypothetical protein
MVGQDLTVTRGDLDDVCLFYREIARDLCGGVDLVPAERKRAPPTRSPSSFDRSGDQPATLS